MPSLVLLKQLVYLFQALTTIFFLYMISRNIKWTTVKNVFDFHLLFNNGSILQYFQLFTNILLYNIVASLPI